MRGREGSTRRGREGGATRGNTATSRRKMTRGWHSERMMRGRDDGTTRGDTTTRRHDETTRRRRSERMTSIMRDILIVRNEWFDEGQFTELFTIGQGLLEPTLV